MDLARMVPVLRRKRGSVARKNLVLQRKGEEHARKNAVYSSQRRYTFTMPQRTALSTRPVRVFTPSFVFKLRQCASTVLRHMPK